MKLSWRFARITATFGFDTCASPRAFEDLKLIGMQKNITRIALGTGFILLIPLVAMQFTEEVKWGVFDFIFMGALLFCTGLAFVLLARKARTVSYKAGVGIALAAGLLLVWVNAAVGIIGSDEAFNVLYLGALAVGVVGALVARFEPPGMARAMFATALALALVPVVALILWPSVVIDEPPGAVGVFILNSFFVLLFVVSALLFRRAAGSPAYPPLSA
jgi:hypothetical protein